LILKMEAVSSSEMPVNFYHTTQHHIPEAITEGSCGSGLCTFVDSCEHCQVP
jgi:hypothetical protein